MKKYAIIGAGALALSSTAAMAGSPLPGGLPGEISANVGMATDYSFRGISQTDRGPAIQGGMDYAVPLHDGINFYSGIWGSNLNYNDGDETDIEIDYYGGLTLERNNFTFDAGAVYFAYPGASGNLEYDFWEFKTAVGYEFPGVAVEASFNYSPDYFGGTGDSQYYSFSAAAPLPLPVEGLTIDGHVGTLQIDDPTQSYVDYVDWSVGLGYEWEGFGLALQYVDTDLKRAECGMTKLCDGRVIGSVSHSF